MAKFYFQSFKVVDFQTDQILLRLSQILDWFILIRRRKDKEVVWRKRTALWSLGWSWHQSFIVWMTELGSRATFSKKQCFFLKIIMMASIQFHTQVTTTYCKTKSYKHVFEYSTNRTVEKSIISNFKYIDSQSNKWARGYYVILMSQRKNKKYTSHMLITFYFSTDDDYNPFFSLMKASPKYHMMWEK